MAAVVAAGLLSSCDDALYNEGVGVVPSTSAHYLYAPIQRFTLPDTVVSPQVFTVNSIATPWRINVADSWLKLSQASGDGAQRETAVEASAEINTSTHCRLSVLNLEAATDTAEFRYSQNIVAEQTGDRDTYVSVSCTSPLLLSASATTFSFTVETNSPTIRAYAEDAWLTVTQAGGEVSLTVAENQTTASRTTYINFDVTYREYESAEATVETFVLEVQQAAPNITATTQSVSFLNTAATQRFTVNSDIAWTATTSDSWISVSPQEGGAGETAVSVSVTENGGVDERRGAVTLTMANGQRIEIPVVQSGIYLYVGDTALEFASTAGYALTTFSTNLTLWDVVSCPEWASAEVCGPEGDSLRISVADNPNTTSREAELIVGNEAIGVTQTIRLVQAGKTFGELESVMQFENLASSAQLQITTDGQWTAQSLNGWITVSPTSGSGNAQVTVSVAENTSDSERTGLVAVAVGGTVRYVNVVQKGRYFTIDRSAATLPSTGGAIELAIATNQTWTATVAGHSPWLALSPTEGEGNANIIVSAADNPSLQSRTDTVAFTPGGGVQGVKLVVTQAGRYLRASARSVAFFYKGGTAAPVTIETDGTFRVERPAEAAWLTVAQNNNVVLITASPYDGSDRRTATVSVYLTGLEGAQPEAKMAEIVVTQFSKDTQFIRNDYDADVSLEIIYKDGAVVSRTDYDTDVPAENTPADGADMGLEGFGGDQAAEDEPSGNGSIGRNEYGADQNLEE